MTVAHSPRQSRVLIVAAAGYGKSSALEADRPASGVRRTARDLLAGGIPHAPWLGVDDLDQLAPPEQVEIFRQLAQLPPETGLAIASRTAIAATARGRLRGQVYERGPQDLALEQYPIARLLAEEYAVLDPEAAGRVLALTAGWPALVHFAADVLARQHEVDLSHALTRSGSAAATWVASNVLDGLPDPARHVLDVVAELGPVTPGLVARLWGDDGDASLVGPVGPVGPVGSVEAVEAVDQLRRMGVLVPLRRLGSEGPLAVVPVVAGVLAAQRPMTGDADRLRAAALAYEDEGLAFLACRSYARAGDRSAVERLVAERGDDMLRQGDARGVVELLGGLPAAAWSPPVQRTYADALRTSGDAAAARRTFQRLCEAADRDGWQPALATRVATMHYMQGDLEAGLEVLDRVDPAGLPADLDGVEWRACRVQLMSRLGRREQTRSLAVETLQVAEALGDPRALSVAHLAMARTESGSRKEADHEQALRAATETGDAVMAAGVLVNQSHLLLATARYGEACVVARESVRLAELCSPTGRLVAALHNLGEALTMVGEYDEAKWQLQRAVALSRRLGPGRCAMGLLGIADIHRRLGQEEQGRSVYLEAVSLARGSNELPMLVPALAGLARLEAVTGTDHARAAAEEAERIATPALLPFALVALGWVALAQGDQVQATQRGRDAVASARSTRQLDLLADALELVGETADDADEARAALAESLSIWRDGGAGPAAARIEVLLGGLDGANGTARSQARDAARTLQRIGILHVNGHPVAEGRTAKPVAIGVLGGFTVSINGQPVPLTAWRSRQARTLVKILAARRGRPLTRAYVCELLWPDDDPLKTGHRLSVLLTTVRGVLDPERVWPPERYIAADLTGIWLDLRYVALDADSVLQDAAHAADLMEEGDADRAREILADIDSSYRGDAFEDEQGEEWAEGLREEVRAAWLRSVRRLATLRSREGRVDEAQGLLVRLLVADPYDEQVHRMLVRTLARAGRHGEARRCFERWSGAMRAIDAPLPDPAVLRTDAAASTTRIPRPRAVPGGSGGSARAPGSEGGVLTPR